MSLGIPRMQLPPQQDNTGEEERYKMTRVLSRRVGNIIMTHIDIVQVLYSADAKYIHQGAILSNIHKLMDLRIDYKDVDIATAIINEFQSRISRIVPPRQDFMDPPAINYIEIRAADLLNQALYKIKELRDIKRLISWTIKTAPTSLIDTLGLREPLPAPALDLPGLELSLDGLDIHTQLQSIHDRTVDLERLIKNCMAPK